MKGRRVLISRSLFQCEHIEVALQACPLATLKLISEGAAKYLLKTVNTAL